MFLEDRINTFIQLGDRLKSLEKDELDALYSNAANENAWFTRRSIDLALKGILKLLTKEALTDWLSAYSFDSIKPKKIGVIAAGNLPLVGFHDVLSVLISGHSLMLKPSSDDKVLMSKVLSMIQEVEPRFSDQIQIIESLNEAEAYIATGSDNSARYFRYYFKDKPNVIRANRTSVAIISGNENDAELQNLGKDIFEYYGLGCRNVSKVYVPEGYELSRLIDELNGYDFIGDHHKYRNNYDYNKSIYLVNKESHLDNGFVLFKESNQLVSPISVVFYETYKNESELKELIDQYYNKIQCIVGRDYIPFGNAQFPSVKDYADGVDTMKFLIGL